MKDSNFRKQQQKDRIPNFHYNSQPQSNYEYVTVTVIPCGREEQGKNQEEDELPYEIQIKKKQNENSLKEIFQNKNQYCDGIFKQHLSVDSTAPTFSIYRKPFEHEQDPSKSDLYLHILYMKSSEKALTRNYNAQQLELFCHNRFYGPLIVAYNLNKPPYYLINFTIKDLNNIELINKNFQNKSIKDDYVPDCLLNFALLQQNLDRLYKKKNQNADMPLFTFYMFKYKTSWCPNKKDSHDSKSCVYAHHTRDFRRPPDIFKYLPEDCETLINGVGWDKCEFGLKCDKCHTTVERLYHPEKYKRIFCDRTRCNKSEICAFFHSPKERSQANKEHKMYWKKWSEEEWKDEDITQVHQQLLSYYTNQTKEELKEESDKASQNQTYQEQQNYYTILNNNSPDMFVQIKPRGHMSNTQYTKTQQRDSYLQFQDETQKNLDKIFKYIDDQNTRPSTFSKKSDSREEYFRYYEAFNSNKSCFDIFATPVDNEEEEEEEKINQITQKILNQDNLKSPNMQKQQSIKSPNNLNSPVLLDFLEDDNFFNQVDEKNKFKSKTEFVRRQDSEDSNGLEFMTGDQQEYLNSIFNNSIKFNKPTQSRFSFSQKK